MLRFFATLGVCAAGVLSAPAGGARPSSSSNLTVDIGYAVYEGVHNASTGLNVWKGIRYAAAPVGALRWRAPQTPTTNRTVQAASAFGPACPQAYPAVPNAPFIPGDEDCLFLNVYAPAKKTSSRPLPVLVWIHGGGYGLGAGTQDMSTIIDANRGSFVAVAIQYRLGAFGFLASSEIAKEGVTNAALLDMAFALNWVQQNIHKFGGDRTKVTISGESAGGGAVMLLGIAEGGKLGTSLFRSGIAASPYLPPQYPYNSTIPTQHFWNFASQAGCIPNATTSAVSCLRAADTERLQLANYNVTVTGAYGSWAFLPVTDYSFIRSTPSAALAAKRVNGKAILVGNNANEGPLFVPATINTEEDVRAWLKMDFPGLGDNDIQAVLDAYPSGDAPVDPSAPKFATDGIHEPTAVTVSQVATGQQQRAYNIYAEATFVCPSYWLNTAYSPSNASHPKRSYHYQYSVPFASHGDDVTGYFGPSTPNQSPSFSLTFRRIWGDFVTSLNPAVSSDPVLASWPQWVGGNASKMVNLNETGGTPYVTTVSGGVNVTQFMEPGLVNDFAVVDAWSWEGERGKRCEFWRSIAEKVPI